jgi:hypothetical protein
MRCFQAIHQETGLESDRRQTSKTMLGRVKHNRKIMTRKQRIDVGKYSFVIRIIKRWNQLPAGLLASFPCSLSAFTKRVKKTVTSKMSSRAD